MVISDKRWGTMPGFDRIIIGAGIYGLYSAVHCGKKDENILVLEADGAPFMRATYINQARVHLGYHYPRSLLTATKSASYFDRFNSDFDFCVKKDFTKIYATSESFSWTSGRQFKRFCEAAGIPCKEVPAEDYFRPGMCDGAFLVTEYTYDAAMLKDHFVEQIKAMSNVTLKCGCAVTAIERDGDCYKVTAGGETYSTKCLINTTYASVNQILDMLDLEKFKIKYELCEIILCEADEELKGLGLTVMDGPFFSIMPFGKTGLHSLTSVTFTPHVACFDSLPAFACQERSGGYCSPRSLGNCDSCPARPESAFPYMDKLASKYLRDGLRYRYKKSLFSMKPILQSSEVDDSRPTVIRRYSGDPVFISVLSGKINTIYDLDEVLDNV
uniref:Fumarate reductase/succinate dehydrogenase flavoprotein domain protein n=1 Tax=uncultured bacterium Contig783 TaxID=1393612 RepID=W0FIS3_9BACT|nr:fumarate reductase/succinate dehydrogenase flavoprotein domain protein [uncultured bacterium Contig783]